jgi:hypothetical protein
VLEGSQARQCHETSNDRTFQDYPHHQVTSRSSLPDHQDCRKKVADLFGFSSGFATSMSLSGDPTGCRPAVGNGCNEKKNNIAK